MGDMGLGGHFPYGHCHVVVDAETRPAETGEAQPKEVVEVLRIDECNSDQKGQPV
jgi:hypothetical protein